MLPLQDLKDADLARIDGLILDIDDTLTTEGRLTANAYAALEALHDSGLRVVPITGRPAGWWDHIARMWPVDAVVGENGAFYFWHDVEARKLRQRFLADDATRAANAERVKMVAAEILQAVPGCALASDQFCRIADIAIDFCEDVPPLPKSEVERIATLMRAAGMTAKISSIHVNGWFGDYDKLAMARRLMQERYGVDARAFALTLDGGAPSIAVEPELTGDTVVSDLSYDARSRRVTARISVPGSMALRLKPVRIAGQLVETVEVVVPKRAVARGETLGKNDVLVERRPRDGQATDLIGDPRVAIDKVATRALMAGAPLRANDLRREEIVAKGDLVTLVYESRGLTITMRGRAGEAGAMGDVISVTNPQSKRVLHGTVSGPGRISVQASTSGTIAAAP
jgi:flagella basal body P-ring formation protein FlgA